MIKKYKVASPPHYRRQTTARSTMIDVVISLIPSILMAIRFFGFNIAKLVIVSIISAGLSQFIAEKLFAKKTELWDYSFVVTAILLALTLPHTTPAWVAAIGNVFAIVIGKVIFGGLGKNIFNPALLGRVFLMVSYPQYILNYRAYDGGAGATILPLMKYRGVDSLYTTFGGRVEFYRGLLTGHGIYGSMGEVSVVAIAIGLIYLKLKGHVKLQVPITLLLTVFVGSYILGYNPFIYTLSGGLVFAAVYMATDMVTSPYTKVGGIIYAILIGLMVIVIRTNTSHPEGTAYAILFANLFVPFINRYTKPRVFGKGYRMKEIKIAILSLIIVVFAVFAVFKIDEIVRDSREEKRENYKKSLMLSLVKEGHRLGEDRETVIYGRQLFRPVFNTKDEKIAYVIVGEAKGYSQDILKFILAIDLEGRSIGHIVLEHNETNGLGSRITDDEWKGVFINLDKNSRFNPNKDAFAGATFTFANMHRSIMEIIRAYDRDKSIELETDYDLDGEAGATDLYDDYEDEVEEENTEETDYDLDGEAGATDWVMNYEKSVILWV